MATYLSNIGKILAKYGMKFAQGLGVTLMLSAVSVVVGSILGVFIALGRMSKNKPLRTLAQCYIQLLRGTPLLLQLYLFWILLPMIPGLSGISNLTCVMVALIINSSAYIAEVIRAGIQAVDPGQREAAVSLGMREKDIMSKVIMPQAVKNILPALGNEFIVQIKETSMASVFMAGELMTSYKQVSSFTFLSLEPLTIAGMIYLALTIGLSKLLKLFEGRLNRDDA